MRAPTYTSAPWAMITRPMHRATPSPTSCLALQHHASPPTCRSLLTSSTSPRARYRRSFHPSPASMYPRKRDFFTSNVYMHKSTEASESSPVEDASATIGTPPQGIPPKRKPRTTGVKKSLRRVAIIAQQPPTQRPVEEPTGATTESPDLISAVCVAEGFNMGTVPELLSSRGYEIDPDNTGFEAAEVVHARDPEKGGDILVFPSGTVVTWSVPIEEVTRALLPAAEDLHAPGRQEVEDLEYICDPQRDTSLMKGDLVVLGTRRESTDSYRLDTTLAKVAFSSGLARSTKLAVLEADLASYFEHTRAIPSILAQGSRLPLSRTFIHKKTGELLSLSARLNNYSELTDSLPDIFWDSRADLGLEGYYDQVGRALDVNVRIRTLNQRLDYAQDIASVLREMSSERHSTRLEVIIILLIAVEVVFELRREWKEYYAKKAAAAAEGEKSPAA